jgi:hypothetical protein
MPTADEERRSMIFGMIRIVLSLAIRAAPVAQAEPDLGACYTFGEREDATAHAGPGTGPAGTIHGAEWVRSARGRALAIGAAGGYVDCGRELGRRLSGDMTLMAWIRLKPAAYPDSSTNWTIAECEDYPRSGFIVRVDGQTAKLYYRASAAGRIPDGFSRQALASDVWHHVAVTRAGNQVVLFVDGLPDMTFAADHPALPSQALKISSPGQPFQGIIAGLSLYDRAWSRDEILGRYKAHAAAYGKDTSWLGTFRLAPFFYLDRGRATVAVDFLGVLPLPAGAAASVELGKLHGPAVQTVAVTKVDESGRGDFSFDLAGLAAGDYEIRAVLRDAQGRVLTRKGVPLRYPPAPISVARPAERIVAALAEAGKPFPFALKVGARGGLGVQLKGRTFPVVSEFSYPHGGFNAIGPPAGAGRRGEAAWNPAVEKLAPGRYRVAAAGKYYALARSIEAQPGRVVVRDTITNRTAEPLGIFVRHTLAPAEGMLPAKYVAGYRCGGPVTGRPIKSNPTLFLSGREMGLGLVALDDVLIVQSLATVENDSAMLHTDTFALDKNASYTLEWAIYPAGSGDYYDFINQVRRDEGRNGSVDGGLGFISRGPGDRRGVPARESVELRNLKYGILHCLSYTADDPGVSIEGIEFVDYPKERRLLAEQIAAIRKACPGMKVLFHVAHSLYATNRPAGRFADSRVIDAAGRQAVYTSDPGGYFSRERLGQGWNWYIYYPTPENSFGRAMLKSVDVMMDEIGADGPFMDGFMWAYGGQYTFDRWDGHTAEIDRQTKTIVRKMGSVLLLSQDALVAFCRKIRAKGGVVIANNSVITRTIGRENYLLHDRECFAGPEVHLASTPLALSLPSAIRSEPDVHRDVLDKLAWGNLYVYYEEGKLTYSSAPARMYPLTFDEIHSGYVKGRERLIASRPGVYGWPGDRDLHFVWLFDARGVGIAHRFLSTGDSTGVRTELDLAGGQCAVVRRVPVGIESASPVNFHLSRYDPRGCELVASGRGAATLTLRSGELRIEPGMKYVLRKGATDRQPVIAAGSRLTVPLELADDVRISIERD